MRLPTTMSAPLRLRVQAQNGVWTRQDAVQLGHHDDDLARWVRRGLVKQACRGAYYAPLLDEPGGPDRERQELRRRARAILAVLPSTLVLSHHTAVTAYGIARLERVRHDEPLHVMAVAGRPQSVRAELRVHRTVAGAEVRTRGDLRLVGVADALAQYAAAEGLEAGVVAADDALHRGLVTVERLSSACERMHGRRGAKVLRPLLGHVDGSSESVGESRTRLVCVAAGIPVQPQVEIRDRAGAFVARVDLMVRNSRVVIEFDGMDKYRGEDNATALVREKRREHELHRLGYVVVRVTWEDLREPHDVVRRIREEVRRCQAA